MADVVYNVGLAKQVRLVAQLRWRILMNGLRNKSKRLDLIGMIVVGVFGLAFVLGLATAFCFLAEIIVTRRHGAGLSLLFWAIFLWWQILPIFAAGFGSTFPFRTLLRFPLRQTAFYILSLAYGIADFSALAACCWMAAILIGVTIASPPLFFVTAAICVVFLLLNVTLERLIGSWLERLLEKRRVREIVLAMFLLAMMSFNFIGPYVGHYGNRLPHGLEKWLPYFQFLPGTLAGSTILGAISRQPMQVLIGFAGLCLYIAAFSGLLWMRSVAQYRGELLSEGIAPKQPKRKSQPRAEDSPSALPALANSKLSPVLQVAIKEVHYLTRNGFSFFLLIMPPLAILMFTQNAGNWFGRGKSGMSSAIFFPGIMGYMVLVLMAPAYNSFAYEGRGIQTYFLAPIRFRDIFLGKNLVMVTLVAIEVFLAIVTFHYRVGLPELPVLFATCAAVVFTVTGQLSIANWSSLNFPRKLEFGQMRGQRQSGMAVLCTFATQIVLGACSGVVFFSARWTGNQWLPVEAFCLLSLAALGGYFAALNALSQLAESKKEVLTEALCR